MRTLGQGQRRSSGRLSFYDVFREAVIATLVYDGLGGNESTVSAAPTTSATRIVSAETNRLTLALYNNGTVTVYLGNTSAVATTTGVPLEPGDWIVAHNVKSAKWGITANGLGDIRGFQTI